MLFKGTTTRSAEDIAQQIDSIGGQLDAFTSKEYAGYYIKVLDEHLPLAIDVLTDLVVAPAFAPDDIEREKKVVLEEIKMVEDTPDDLVHEMFAGGFWNGHPLGRPILGQPDDGVGARPADLAALLRRHLRGRQLRRRRPSATSSTTQVRGLVERGVRGDAGRGRGDRRRRRRSSSPGVLVRAEGSRAEPRVPRHVGAAAESPDRYAAYALNTMLGGSMSSRLFQNVREKRGLAYAVFSSLSAYRDAGALSIYAGCGNDARARAGRRRRCRRCGG